MNLHDVTILFAGRKFQTANDVRNVLVEADRLFQHHQFQTVAGRGGGEFVPKLRAVQIKCKGKKCLRTMAGVMLRDRYEVDDEVPLDGAQIGLGSSSGSSSSSNRKRGGGSAAASGGGDAGSGPGPASVAAPAAGGPEQGQNQDGDVIAVKPARLLSGVHLVPVEASGQPLKITDRQRARWAIGGSHSTSLQAVTSHNRALGVARDPEPGAKKRKIVGGSAHHDIVLPGEPQQAAANEEGDGDLLLPVPELVLFEDQEDDLLADSPVPGNVDYDALQAVYNNVAGGVGGAAAANVNNAGVEAANNGEDGDLEGFGGGAECRDEDQEHFETLYGYADEVGEVDSDDETVKDSKKRQAEQKRLDHAQVMYGIRAQKHYAALQWEREKIENGLFVENIPQVPASTDAELADDPGQAADRLPALGVRVGPDGTNLDGKKVLSTEFRMSCAVIDVDDATNVRRRKILTRRSAGPSKWMKRANALGTLDEVYQQAEEIGVPLPGTRYAEPSAAEKFRMLLSLVSDSGGDVVKGCKIEQHFGNESNEFFEGLAPGALPPGVDARLNDLARFKVITSLIPCQLHFAHLVAKMVVKAEKVMQATMTSWVCVARYYLNNKVPTLVATRWGAAEKTIARLCKDRETLLSGVRELRDKKMVPENRAHYNRVLKNGMGDDFWDTLEGLRWLLMELGDVMAEIQAYSAGVKFSTAAFRKPPRARTAAIMKKNMRVAMNCTPEPRARVKLFAGYALLMRQLHYRHAMLRHYAPVFDLLNPEKMQDAAGRILEHGSPCDFINMLLRDFPAELRLIRDGLRADLSDRLWADVAVWAFHACPSAQLVESFHSSLRIIFNSAKQAGIQLLAARFAIRRLPVLPLRLYADLDNRRDRRGKLRVPEKATLARRKRDVMHPVLQRLDYIAALSGRPIPQLTREARGIVRRSEVKLSTKLLMEAKVQVGDVMRFSRGTGANGQLLWDGDDYVVVTYLDADYVDFVRVEQEDMSADGGLLFSAPDLNPADEAQFTTMADLLLGEGGAVESLRGRRVAFEHLPMKDVQHVGAGAYQLTSDTFNRVEHAGEKFMKLSARQAAAGNGAGRQKKVPAGERRRIKREQLWKKVAVADAIPEIASCDIHRKCGAAKVKIYLKVPARVNPEWMVDIVRPNPLLAGSSPAGAPLQGVAGEDKKGFGTTIPNPGDKKSIEWARTDVVKKAVTELGIDYQAPTVVAKAKAVRVVSEYLKKVEGIDAGGEDDDEESTNGGGSDSEGLASDSEGADFSDSET